jgi:hypothetical protein
MGEEALLIRDRNEIERRRDEEARLNRIASIERSVDVLKTILDGALRNIVSDEDLKELKREVELEMNKQITHICEHFDDKNTQQSTEIIGHVKNLLQTQSLETSAEARRMRQQIFLAVFTTGLGVIATIVVTLALRAG